LTILARGVGEHVLYYGGSLLKGLVVPMALVDMLSCKLLSAEAAVFSIYTLRKGVPVLAALARSAQLRDTVDPAVVLYSPGTLHYVTEGRPEVAALARSAQLLDTVDPAVVLYVL
jgi:hypothetical protein